MLYYIVHSALFGAMIDALGYFSLFVLIAVILIFAGIAVIYGIMWFVKTFFKEILIFSFICVLVMTAVFYGNPFVSPF